MYDYYEEENYYEPTVADEIFLKAKKELEECLKEEIKSKIKTTMDYNHKLRVENEELKQQIRNLDNRERDLKNKELQFERTAVRKVFSELLKPIEEKMEVYSVDYISIMGDKCDKCDTNRKIYYKSPSGKDMYEECSCGKRHYVYVPKLKNLTNITIVKNYNKTSFTFDVTYQSKEYDDSFCKFEVRRLINNIDELGDLSSTDSFQVEYHTGFKNKEDCQKYCDFLNEKRGIPQYILDKVNYEL